MQCLCIGSDSNDGDNTGDEGHGKQANSITIIDLIQKHHYLGRRKKTNYSCTVVGLHLLCFFFMNDKDFPKISGPTCRLNVMSIVIEVFFSEYTL